MFIGCETTSSWPDYYWISDINTLDELQIHIQNKMPIKGYKIDRRYKKNIVITTEMYHNLIYLNNYHNIFEVNLSFFSKEDHAQLEKGYCVRCVNYDDMFGCSTSFKPCLDNEKMCARYQQSRVYSLIEWIKSKLT